MSDSNGKGRLADEEFDRIGPQIAGATIHIIIAGLMKVIHFTPALWDVLYKNLEPHRQADFRRTLHQWLRDTR